MFRCGVLRHGIAAAALCLSGTTAAQADDPPPATAANESQDPSRSKWAAVWGTSPPSGVFYLPYGGHNNALKVASFQLVGGIVKSIYGMTFINSRGARTWSLGFERDVLRFHRLSLGWGAGLMVGYHGSLADSDHLPLAHTFLFEHGVNPVVGVPLHVDLTKRVQFKSLLTPLVILAGFEVTFRGNEPKRP